MSACTDTSTAETGSCVPYSGMGYARADVIGPNAITRVAQALRVREGDAKCWRIFARAGLERHIDDPPVHMVEARDVAALHRALIECLGVTAAARVSWDAGRLTGDYLLANRIPRGAQYLLQALPRALTARVLVRAIARYAWTFAGAGTFSHGFEPLLTLRLTGSPICRQLRTTEPACHYFAGAFERVFGAMLGRQVRVVETECAATGASACVFRVTWR